MAIAHIQTAIDRYLKYRSELLALGKEHPELIGGNDNIIGRIGEYIAMRFLQRTLGQRPKKVLHPSNPGFDLTEGRIRTQVKVITEENQRGRSMRVRPGWDQFVLVELGAEYKPHRIGVLSVEQHQAARQGDARLSAEPFASRSMLNEGGLIGRFGAVYARDEIKL
jgi:hypothetical protein